MHRIFFALILLLSSQAFAAEVRNLYQSEQPVSSQSEEERQAVSADILRQVILKVVGDSELLQQTDISPILEQSNQLIRQYEYERINVIADDLTEPDRLEVVLSFKPSAVDQLIRDQQLPIWGTSRPETLIWLAVDQGGQRSIVSSDLQTTLTDTLLAEAEARGIPVLLPVMDLQDQSKVKYTDISAGFLDNIEQASQRYGSPVTLTALAKVADSGNVQIAWKMLLSGQPYQWQSRGDTSSAIKSGIDHLANKLAREFSQVITNPDSATLLAIKVLGVENYSDYVRVMNYLKMIQYVDDVQVTSLSNGSVDLKLNYAGDISVFNKTIAVGRILKEEPYSVAGTINYRLIP
jgi:hypothetical protein